LDGLNELLVLAENHKIGSLEHALESETIRGLYVLKLSSLEIVLDRQFKVEVCFVPFSY